MEVAWSGWEVVWSGWEVVWNGVEFHFSLRATRDWKSESVTDLLTDGRTLVGARDTCVSKNNTSIYTKSRLQSDRCEEIFSISCLCLQMYNVYRQSCLCCFVQGGKFFLAFLNV